MRALGTLRRVATPGVVTRSTPMASTEAPRPAPDVVSPVAPTEQSKARFPYFEPPLSWIPTSRLEPCVLAGSLALGLATLYAEPTGEAALAHVVGTLRIDRLELPAASGGRYKLVLGYPVRMTAWLDARDHPIELPVRVEVPGGNIWVEAGAAASAYRAEAGRAQLTASIPSQVESFWDWPNRELLSIAEFANIALEPDIRVSPSEVQTVAACTDLLLTGSRTPRWRGMSDDGAVWRLLVGGDERTIGLFRTEGDTIPFARVRGHTGVRVLGRKGALTHVAGTGAGYTYEAWVRSEDVSERSAAVGGLLPATPGHDAFSPRGPSVGIRLKPERTAPIAMTLSPDAAVYMRRLDTAFAEVAIAEFAAGDPRYFVERSALKPYAAQAGPRAP